MIQVFKPYVSEEAIAAVADVLRSGWIGLGPKTAEFEARFAEFVGARHAVAVNSATAALHLALIVSDIGAGDEVLTTSLTFVSTNEVILYQRANPVFVDVDDQTLNIDLAQAESLVSPRTRAIIAVHYGGNPIDMRQLYAFGERHGLVVIEDAAHACGAKFGDRRVGSFGLTCFSFHAVKNLPVGDGGMITTDDPRIYERLMRLRWMGIDRSTFNRSDGGYQWEYNVPEVGYKYHMADTAAAIGLEHLKRLDQWNERRAEVVSIYREELSGIDPTILRFVEQTPASTSSHHLCVARVKQRDDVVKQLGEQGIGVGVHYKANHTYPPFEQARRGTLQTTEQACREVMSLPVHLLLKDDDVRHVCATLRRILSDIN